MKYFSPIVLLLVAPLALTARTDERKSVADLYSSLQRRVTNLPALRYDRNKNVWTVKTPRGGALTSLIDIPHRYIRIRGRISRDRTWTTEIASFYSAKGVILLWINSYRKSADGFCGSRQKLYRLENGEWIQDRNLLYPRGVIENIFKKDTPSRVLVEGSSAIGKIPGLGKCDPVRFRLPRQGVRITVTVCLKLARTLLKRHHKILSAKEMKAAGEFFSYMNTEPFYLVWDTRTGRFRSTK